MKLIWVSRMPYWIWSFILPSWMLLEICWRNVASWSDIFRLVSCDGWVANDALLWRRTSFYCWELTLISGQTTTRFFGGFRMTFVILKIGSFRARLLKMLGSRYSICAACPPDPPGWDRPLLIPWWNRLCLQRLDLYLKVFSQPGWSHTNGLDWLWEKMCSSRYYFRENCLSHIGQTYLIFKCWAL